MYAAYSIGGNLFAPVHVCARALDVGIVHMKCAKDLILCLQDNFFDLHRYFFEDARSYSPMKCNVAYRFNRIGVSTVCIYREFAVERTSAVCRQLPLLLRLDVADAALQLLKLVSHLFVFTGTGTSFREGILKLSLLSCAYGNTRHSPGRLPDQSDISKHNIDNRAS